MYMNENKLQEMNKVKATQKIIEKLIYLNLMV